MTDDNTDREFAQIVAGMVEGFGENIAQGLAPDAHLSEDEKTWLYNDVLPCIFETGYYSPEWWEMVRSLPIEVRQAITRIYARGDNPMGGSWGNLGLRKSVRQSSGSRTLIPWRSVSKP